MACAMMKPAQHVDAARESATDRGKRIEHEAERERRLAPVVIRERPVEDLSDGEADEECRERQLHGIDRRTEFARNRGESRQIHVDGERCEGADRSEDQHQANARRGLLHQDSLGKLCTGYAAATAASFVQG
jgi:hypothetical protein